MPQTETPFSLRLARIAAAVETMLDGLLSPVAGQGEIARPARLLAAMRHGVLGGGKRLRAFLVVETAALTGGAEAGALRAAAAVECLHAYSLIHDDLPAMDDDDLRRGHPTVHRAFDEATAILAGDALLTLAFDILSDPATHADGAVRADLVSVLARRAGLGGMVGGQMLDLAAEGRFPEDASTPDAEAVRRIQSMKTGALIRASVAIGALLGGAEAADRQRLDRYADRFGAAFQIADDILDLESDAAALGKATGKDDAKGKATLANRLGLSAAKQELKRLTADAVAALEPFGAKADLLRAAARYAAKRRS
ncbi:MAG: geranylgeranyl pyrophosphate synthase [Rhizobiales bacterium 65-9]|nr:polyprenyl synthetase family protein [Hyphomicrobiales bacterium]OJY32873.1 MAG: geranylgeranyl pyrophosphate synthase [Rhizobiales bacterium 65-9]